MGVDTLIDETPVPWLDRGKPPPVVATPAQEQPPVVSTLPSTLVGLQQWLAASSDVPGAGPRRLPFSGEPSAALMILMDMPLASDVESGLLLSGEVGLLFDNMLIAMNTTRAECYIATLCPSRSPSGQIDKSDYPRLGEIARLHIALSGAKQVWLLGDAVSCAVLGTSMMDARGNLHKINHGNESVEAVVSFSPAFLHAQPKFKKKAWEDMQLLLRGTGA